MIANFTNITWQEHWKLIYLVFWQLSACLYTRVCIFHKVCSSAVEVTLSGHTASVTTNLAWSLNDTYTCSRDSPPLFSLLVGWWTFNKCIFHRLLTSNSILDYQIENMRICHQMQISDFFDLKTTYTIRFKPAKLQWFGKQTQKINHKIFFKNELNQMFFTIGIQEVFLQQNSNDFEEVFQGSFFPWFVTV